MTLQRRSDFRTGEVLGQVVGTGDQPIAAVLAGEGVHVAVVEHRAADAGRAETVAELPEEVRFCTEAERESSPFSAYF